MAVWDLHWLLFPNFELCNSGSGIPTEDAGGGRVRVKVDFHFIYCYE